MAKQNRRERPSGLPVIEDLGVEHQRSRAHGGVIQEFTDGETTTYRLNGNGYVLRARHHVGGQVVAVGMTNTREHTIDFLFQAGILDSAAGRRGGEGKASDDREGGIRYEAAQKLRLLFDDAGVEPRASARYGHGTGGGKGEMSDEQAIAQGKLRRILAAGGPIFPFNTIVENVVCWGNMPESRHIDALRKGLDALASWFGLRNEAPRRPIRGGPLT